MKDGPTLRRGDNEVVKVLIGLSVALTNRREENVVRRSDDVHKGHSIVLDQATEVANDSFEALGVLAAGEVPTLKESGRVLFQTPKSKQGAEAAQNCQKGEGGE